MELVLVIDPRVGQGPGIGGFKPTSEIGDAFKAGHSVYFASFTAQPVEGQRIEDVARALTIFIEKVAQLHPEALGKPFVIGNKFSTGQIITSDGIRLDIREVKAPIVCFCSHGDNITPPEQALDWILDNYQNVDEIRKCGQRFSTPLIQRSAI
jgi:hypothetical protein